MILVSWRSVSRTSSVKFSNCRGRTKSPITCFSQTKRLLKSLLLKIYGSPNFHDPGWGHDLKFVQGVENLVHEFPTVNNNFARLLVNLQNYFEEIPQIWNATILVLVFRCFIILAIPDDAMTSNFIMTTSSSLLQKVRLLTLFHLDIKNSNQLMIY